MILCGARSFNTQLHDEAAFEHHAVTKLAADAREESIEDEALAPSGEVPLNEDERSRASMACLNAAALA